MLNNDTFDSIQNNFAEIWARKDCKLCAKLWVNQEADLP